MSLKWYGKEIEEKLEAATEAGLIACSQMIESGASLLCPVNLGRLRGSITYKTYSSASKTRGKAKAGDGVQSVPRKNQAYIGTNVEYAIAVEYGRRPGKMPPIEPLVEWVHQKGLAGRYSTKTHRRVGGKQSQLSEDRRVAFAIAMKLKRTGMEPKSFLRASADHSRPLIDALFTAQFRKMFK